MIGGSLLSTIAAFLVALGILIVVHELGHFLVAKWLGVKVLRFSVGFGRPLLSRRIGVDQTEWALAAFPLGGYVKMLDEREGPVEAAEAHRAFNRQSVGRRTLIVLAGPCANLLLAVFLYAGLFMYGVEELRPILAQPAAGSPAEQAGVAAGDMVRSVSGNSVTTLQDMRWQLMQNILDRQPAVLETINERGEISFRNVATATISSEQLESDFSRTLGLVPYQPNPAAIVGSIAEGSPAALAGIQVNDQVLAIDGQPIPGWNEFVKLVRASPGKGLVITLLRAGQKLELAMTPQVSKVLNKAEQEADGLKDEFTSTEHLLLAILDTECESRELLRARGVTREATLEALKSVRGNQRVTDQNPEARYQSLEKYCRDLTELARKEKLDPVIGARDDPQLRAKLFVMVRLGPLSAVARAWRQTWDTAEFTLRMIGRMVIGELSWRNISGPVTIADYAGQSAHLGLDHYFKFLALISISLGVLNLLPIPILDGGHLLYYLFEAIKGDALPERAMEIGQQIGLGLLVLLMAIAFFNDINRLVSG